MYIWPDKKYLENNFEVFWPMYFSPDEKFLENNVIVYFWLMSFWTDKK